MEKYAILIGYFDKQVDLIHRLFEAVKDIDVAQYEPRYVFALKTQQLYTAVEDLLKQIAKAFENHVEDLSGHHKGLLIRLNTEIPQIRPAVIRTETLHFLDKIRAFRHFIRHAYDCELKEEELTTVKKRVIHDFHLLMEDLKLFRQYIQSLV